MLLGLISACAIAPQNIRHPLDKQILRPRLGYKGLTNRACDPDPSGTCGGPITLDHDLNDPAFRATVTKLSFVCSVGGKRYHVCPDKAGLCRYEKRGCGIFCHRVVETDFLTIQNYRFLLDANTVCYSESVYSWGSLR